MKYTLLPSLLITTLMLQSCSNNQRIRDNTIFLTRITESGLKHFKVQSKQAQTQERREGNRPSGVQRKERRVNSEKVEKAMVAAANEHIESNGFCSTGFWVIEANTYAPGLMLRGECNELASEEDRSRYPDTIKVW